MGGLHLKVTIDVECSPEEARAFFGLPDVRPIQESMMAQMQAQMEKAAAGLDPEVAFKALFPLQTGTVADMQKAFCGQFSGKGSE